MKSTNIGLILRGIKQPCHIIAEWSFWGEFCVHYDGSLVLYKVNKWKFNSWRNWKQIKFLGYVLPFS
jgi:hypothetical protein